MADFKAIETQEELDKIITNRLEREREASNKRYEGFISPEDHKKALAAQQKTFDDYKKAHEGDLKTIEELTAKNKEYATAALKSQVARELGLGYEWVERISGNDEKEIRADAEALKKLVGTGRTTLPTKNMDLGTGGDDKDAGLRAVLKSIKNE
jgi:hypothetical protein